MSLLYKNCYNNYTFINLKNPSNLGKMFKFLKQKLKSWTKKVEKEIEKKEKKQDKEIVETKPEKKQAEKIVEEVKKEVQKEKPKGKKAEKPEVEKSEEESKEGFFKKIVKKVSTIEISEEDFSEYSQDLETLLLENNVALEVVDKIIQELKEKLVGKKILKKELESEIKDSFEEAIQSILVKPFDLIDKIKEKIKEQEKQKSHEPFVILFCGINGSGKTTAIAKIAHLLKKNKISCVLAASDTFRAASIEQLNKHGEKLGIKVISQDYGSDPAAVGFDAIKYAKKNFINAVLIDTAGRMHTATNLLKEMEKISRVTKPDLKIFVGESITGNDATEQAKAFNEAIDIDAIILSKSDVDEKGGTVLSVGYVTGKPILYLGTGQNYDDLEKFDKEKFLKKLKLD